MSKRLEIDEVEVCRLYREGATASEIASQIGCSPQTVLRRLRASRIPARRSGHRCAQFTDEEVRRAYVDKGMPVPAVARMLGVGNTTVCRSLRRLGIETRERRTISRPEDIEWLRHAYEVDHLPLSAVAAEFGCSKNCIFRTLRRIGIEPRTSATRASLSAVTTAWLREQYTTLERSSYEIAAEIGCDPKTIWRMLRDRGIETRSREDVMRMTGSMRFWGADNPNYRDGSSNERDLQEIRFGWDELRLSVYTRDGFRCMRCGSRSLGPGTLHAHHLAPWAGDSALRFSADNLVTLCRTCHRWVHSCDNVHSEFLVRKAAAAHDS